MNRLRIVTFMFSALACAALVGCGSGSANNNNTNNTPPAPTFTASNLSGNFVLTAMGTDPTDGDYAVLGSVQADGKGGITGVADFNLGSGIDADVLLTGTYTVSSNGNTTITLTDISGITTTVAVQLTSSGISFPITNFGGTGTGVLLPQTANTFANVGSYNYFISGEGEGNIQGSGSFTTDATGGIASGAENFTDGPFQLNNSPLTGFLGPTTGGRGVAAIGSKTFSYYPVSSSEVALLGLDDTSLIQGGLRKQ